MKDKRYAYSAHTVHNINYHLIWCPKYRRRVLTGDIANKLEVLLKEKSNEIKISIKTMKVMSDQVHLFVKASPVDSPHYIVQQLKGFSSRKLRPHRRSERIFKLTYSFTYLMDTFLFLRISRAYFGTYHPKVH